MEKNLGRHGFTLIEMTVVIMVLILLAGAFVPVAGRLLAQRKLYETLAKMDRIEEACQRFYQDCGRMPRNQDGLIDGKPAGLPGDTCGLYDLAGVCSNAPTAWKGPYIVEGYLGLQGQLSDSFARDGWERAFRYQEATANSITQAFADLFSDGENRKGESGILIDFSGNRTGVNVVGDDLYRRIDAQNQNREWRVSETLEELETIRLALLGYNRDRAANPTRPAPVGPWHNSASYALDGGSLLRLLEDYQYLPSRDNQAAYPNPLAKYVYDGWGQPYQVVPYNSVVPITLGEPTLEVISISLPPNTPGSLIPAGQINGPLP